MTTRHRLAALAVLSTLATLAAGCGPEEPVEGGSSRRPVRVATDPTLNGTSVRLKEMPGRRGCQQLRTGGPTTFECENNGPLLSSTLAWVNLGSVTLAGGAALDGPAALNGTVFSGVAAGGAAVEGAGFVGATFTGVLTSGGQVPVRIDSATPGSGALADVWQYGFSYQDAGGVWQALCAGGAGAVPVLGQWNYQQGVSGGGAKTSDPTVFTVGCQGSAVAKCVNQGYRPWAAASGVSLDAHHQACVRMIRADFCGNGVSWTTEGKTINLYDEVGIASDTEAWLMEAEWTPGGARCVNLLNRSLLGVLCGPLLGTLICGATSHFDTGTLLMSETPLGPLGGLL